MKKILVLLILLWIVAVPVNAQQFTAPTVPGSAEKYMPQDPELLQEGLWQFIGKMLELIEPALLDAADICLSLIAIAIAMSIVDKFIHQSLNIVDVVGALLAGVLLLSRSNTFIQLGAGTVEELETYNKLLLPVMTGALAAQGSIHTSAALYAGTTLFNTILGAIVNKWIVPVLYVFCTVSVADIAVGEGLLTGISKFLKWLMTWSLKVILYVFTGYLTITGVVSGNTDATALRAAKIAISGTVPVVGGIISDASESILVSVTLMKGAAGTYGLFAVLAICVSPLVTIGVQFLLLKLTGTICGSIGTKKFAQLIQQFASAMGIVLSMTVTMLLLIMISIVCLMKGTT